MSDPAEPITLYGYWRSSSSYRVRIALELKALAYEYRAVELRGKEAENWGPDYLALNPQGLVPTLVHGGFRITQSLAIIDYLDAIAPEPPLLPAGPRRRARALALAQIIACDVHPLQNPVVCDHLQQTYGISPGQLQSWRCHWMHRGLAAFAQHLEQGATTAFSVGDSPTVADICLVPQLYNARRFDCALDGYRRLTEIESHCLQLAAFRRAAPEVQPDAG